MNRTFSVLMVALLVIVFTPAAWAKQVVTISIECALDSCEFVVLTKVEQIEGDKVTASVLKVLKGRLKSKSYVFYKRSSDQIVPGSTYIFTGRTNDQSHREIWDVYSQAEEADVIKALHKGCQVGI